MNEFIKLRNSTYDLKNPYIFPLLFLDHYMDKNKTINSNDSILIKRIQNIGKIELKKTLKNQDIDEMLLLLGENQYLDRYIVDTILKFYDDSLKIKLEKHIIHIIKNKDYKSEKLYHLLDICIEGNLDILKDSDLIYMFDKYRSDPDLISLLIDYIDSFKRDGFKDYIAVLLKKDYLDNIKIQLLNLIEKLYSSKEVYKYLSDSKIVNGKNKIFFDTYMDFLDKGIALEKQGISILQSMFYGDFEDSGKGNNGGLAVLLKNLGDEMSKDKRVSSIFTVSITENPDKAFISYYGKIHVFIRLPIYIDKSRSDPFIKRELFIKRYIGDFLRRANIKPHVFHIRYLDNASRAVAKLSSELESKLVFTLAPDPHRNMFDESGEVRNFNFNKLIEKLNKIKIGDELIYKSDGIVGIGNKEIRRELEVYFPQFEKEYISKKIQMIGEGIYTGKSVYDKDSYVDLSKSKELRGIDKDFFEKPIILNVGRLNIQKGQIELLKAWSRSRLSQTHNLLIIGGDKDKPNIEEKIVIDFFKDYLYHNPQLKDKFFHKSAMSNESIRWIENNILKKTFNYPHIYLCSSIKEEFGIAILEAMAQGFLVLGPIKGGVKSYIEDGVNGFLIDTSNCETIAEHSEKKIYELNLSKEKFREIQDAGVSTVEELFSIKKISKEFLSFYLSLKGAKIDEI